jgi:flagellar basal-body rod protein FlgG
MEAMPMNRTRFAAALVLVSVTAAGAWYFTYEMTHSRLRAQFAERERDQALAELHGWREAFTGSSPVGSDPAASAASGLPGRLFESALIAREAQIEVHANNLCNADTIGFKKSRVVFEDLSSSQSGAARPGSGVRISEFQLDFSPGPLRLTDRPLDLAIGGEGFFQVKTRWGGEEIIAYTRAGNFVRNAAGNLVLSNSEQSALEPSIHIPDSAADSDIRVQSGGRVSIRTEGRELQEIGRIELVRMTNPAGMCSIGRNLFVQTDTSGQSFAGYPLSEGFGPIHSGALEGSNVEAEQERAELFLAQSAYAFHLQCLRIGPASKPVALRTALAASPMMAMNATHKLP